MVKGIRGPKSVSFLLATQNQTIEVYNQIDWLLAVFSLATSPIGNNSSPLDQAWINVAVLNQGTQFIDWRDFRILIYVHPKKNFMLTALIGGWGNLYMREYFLVLILNSLNWNMHSQEVAAHYGFSRR